MDSVNSVVVISVLFCVGGACLLLVAICPDALAEAFDCWGIKENTEAIYKQGWDCKAGDLDERNHYFLEFSVRATCFFDASSNV